MVLESTQNICLKSWVRKYLQFYAENFCLSKPAIHSQLSGGSDSIYLRIYLHVLPYSVYAKGKGSEQTLLLEDLQSTNIAYA